MAAPRRYVDDDETGGRLRRTMRRKRDAARKKVTTEVERKWLRLLHEQRWRECELV